MIAENMLEGYYVHESLGYRLSECDFLDSVLDVVLDWIISRPTADHHSERIITQTGETILFVCDVSKRLNYDNRSWKIDCIDFVHERDTYRVFPQSPFGSTSSRRFASKYHIVQIR